MAWGLLSILWIMPALGELPAMPPIGQKVDDFELQDYRGNHHKLSDWSEAKFIVLAFLGTECPLVRQYADRLNELDTKLKNKGVRVVGINANQQDGPTRVAQFAQVHKIEFLILRDVGNVLADRLKAQRTPEVFLLDQERVIRYHGRIDDQYSVGVQRARPTREDLAQALEDLLAGRAVQTPKTEPVGCLIGRVVPEKRRPAPAKAVTFTQHIAPILHKHCVRCHRPGSIAPFSLLTYRQASGWSATIQEVIAAGRMPPWFADPRYGKFVNEARLSDAEKKLIDDWIEQGTPEGDPRELPAPPTFSDEWRIPQPDLIVSMAEEFEIPAQGTVDYQYFEVDPGFTEDKWVQAAELRPGNRAVLHHGLIFLRPPGTQLLVAQGDLESVYLTGSAAGSPPLNLPSGMAKKVPAGWRFVFQMHYTTTGKPERDRSRLGLIFADPKTVQKEVATNMVLNWDLTLQPHGSDQVIEASNVLPHDFLLLSLSPHMHLRGKSFRFQARYPDGNSEVLLDVPRYDFGWQETYYLAQPKRLPRGTVMQCVAHFDNSADNPVNPNPDTTVKWGPQSTDEMMIGYYQIALADQDLTQPAPWHEKALKGIRRIFHPLVAVCLLAGLWLVWRRWGHFPSQV